MTTTTRRTVIAGATALPLLPAAALAVPVTLPLLPVSAFAQPDDPVIATYADWQAMRADYEQVLNTWCALENQHGNKAPEVEAYLAEYVEPETDRICDMEARIAKMVATTPAGLAAQLRIAVKAFDYQGDTEDQEALFVLSALAGAESMARVAS